MSFLNLLLLILIFLLILPSFQQRLLEAKRFGYLRMIERKRKSRLITLIHRRREVSFLGMSFGEFIDIEDAEEILRAVRLTPPSMPIDLVIHTPGGLALATEQIARTLLGHEAKVTVFVPHFAMSGGTLLALAADEIVMDRHAVLGTVDPQVFGFPASAIIKVEGKKSADKIGDKTIMMVDVAQKALAEMQILVREILEKNSYNKETVEKIVAVLLGDKQTHDYPITYEEAKSLGLRVSTIMPPEIYGLLTLYPPPRRLRSPVQYIPVPYRRRTMEEG